MNFTEEQTKVINHPGGHSLISAVAGSGKTEVLVHRVAHLVNSLGVDPELILVLMFNKSAQEVFLSRLKETINEGIELPSVLTFHALGLRILAIWHERTNQEPPVVLDDEHQWIGIAREACERCNQSDGLGMSSHIDQLRKYLAAVDILKNIDYPTNTFDPAVFGWSEQFVIQIKQFFMHFEEIRNEQRLYGLNDLLHAAVAVLRANPEYADEWRDSLQYILVDEYQDSNSLQQWLLERFTHEATEVMVVGDEDQCIYSWRAANPAFMVSGFEQSFNNVTRYKLSKTFRYGHSVALMANHVLQYNSARQDKLVVSGLADTGAIEVKVGSVFDIQDEILALTDSDVVLVRAFQHADDVEWVYQIADKPYKLEGAASFPHRFGGRVLRVALGCALDKKHIPDAIDIRAWIRWVDPECSSGWVDYLAELMSSKGIEAGIRQALELPQMTERQRLHLVQMLIWNGRLHDASGHKDCLGAIARRMGDMWSRAVDEKNRNRPMPLVVSILEHLSKLGWSIQMVLDKLDFWSERESGGPLITSVHRSKGGGWHTVVLPHVERGYFPNTEDATGDPEEERRLFYVAITRAKKKLILAVPEDSVRDTMWKAPTLMDMGQYNGPSSKFVVEALPLYSQEIANRLQVGTISDLDLTPVATRYEREIYPQVRKTRGLFSKLLTSS